MVAPPNTTTQLSHAVTIRAGGQTIGAINGWNPRKGRDITAVYELGVVTGQYAKKSGDPFEKVPGNATGMTVEVRRYDIYTVQMETVFGTVDLAMLTNQDDPFDVRSSWLTPSNVNNYFDLYRGCWFSNIGREISSTGDRIVQASATLEYTTVDKVAQ